MRDVGRLDHKQEQAQIDQIEAHGRFHETPRLRQYLRQSSTPLPHERVPLKWAELQNNLGNALLRLGQRDKAGTGRLEEAAAAYRESGLCTGDFLRAVTNRPEDRVGFSVRRSTKEGIHIFPDNFSISGYFEKASERSFVD